MLNTKKRGYRTERKVRKMFEEHGWKTIRAGASLGEADLICIKKGRCILLQVKSTKDKKFYYYEYMQPVLEGFPFYIVVDFGYGKTRISEPRRTLTPEEGEDVKRFLIATKPKIRQTKERIKRLN